MSCCMKKKTQKKLVLTILIYGKCPKILNTLFHPFLAQNFAFNAVVS